jgi:hypothetical protein
VRGELDHAGEEAARAGVIVEPVLGGESVRPLVASGRCAYVKDFAGECVDEDVDEEGVEETRERPRYERSFHCRCHEATFSCE